MARRGDDRSRVPDPGSSHPQSINDRGEIAGSSQATDGTLHAVLWRDGAIVDLGLLPGSFNTAATSINDRGQVVGFALNLLNPGIRNRGFLWEDGRMIELAPMPGNPTISPWSLMALALAQTLTELSR